jgi:hypothetical protein
MGDYLTDSMRSEIKNNHHMDLNIFIENIVKEYAEKNYEAVLITIDTYDDVLFSHTNNDTSIIIDTITIFTMTFMICNKDLDPLSIQPAKMITKTLRKNTPITFVKNN